MYLVVGVVECDIIDVIIFIFLLLLYGSWLMNVCIILLLTKRISEDKPSHCPLQVATLCRCAQRSTGNAGKGRQDARRTRPRKEMRRIRYVVSSPVCAA